MSGMRNDACYYFSVKTGLRTGISVSSVISCRISGWNILCISQAFQKMVSYWFKTGRYHVADNRIDFSGKMDMDKNFITAMREGENA